MHRLKYPVTLQSIVWLRSIRYSGFRFLKTVYFHLRVLSKSDLLIRRQRRNYQNLKLFILEKPLWQELPSLHGGLFEITLTVPLIKCLITVSSFQLLPVLRFQRFTMRVLFSDSMKLSVWKFLWLPNQLLE